MMNRYQRLAIRLIQGIEHDRWGGDPLSPEELEYYSTTMFEYVRKIESILKEEFGKPDVEVKKGSE